MSFMITDVLYLKKNKGEVSPLHGWRRFFCPGSRSEWKNPPTCHIDISWYLSVLCSTLSKLYTLELHNHFYPQDGQKGELPVGGRGLPVGGRWLPVDGRWLPESGRWLPVGGRWLPEDGRLYPVGGRWLSVCGRTHCRGSHLHDEHWVHHCNSHRIVLPWNRDKIV